ncbi:MAG: choice-of-anchor G family protein [Actinomycetota bacterium]|nr:choice-of-anchor G family protein [Actinomycetota bacterium]MDQ2958442.1 choice-of-anchor G family protein [Actinomycetota bacterium]
MIDRALELQTAFGEPREARQPQAGTGRLRLVVVIGVVVTSMLLLSNSDAKAATAPVSQATGRFLTGTIGGTDLATLAAVQGEAAQSFGTKVLRYNSLDASALNGAVQLPLTNVLQLPGEGVISLGAVGQYADANPDGSALGASGAVGNSGGIGIGGQNGTPPSNATLNLAGLGGSAVANTLGNLQLSIGALAARAQQAAGLPGTQRGSYQIAGLTLDLTAPQLAALINQTITQASTTLASLATAFNGLGLPITVTGLSNLPVLIDELGSVSADGGALTANLRTGSIHLDVAGLLAANGLNLNGLPPNTHLLPYLTQALATALPRAIDSLLNTVIGKLTTGFGQLGFTIAGVPLNANQLALVTPILTGLQTSVTNQLVNAGNQLVGTVFTPLTGQLGRLLDPVVNVQSAVGGTFTERALRLDLLSSSAVLELASASVGPSTITAALPGSGPTAANPVATGPAGNPAVPRSDIKVDAGGGLAPHGMDPRTALTLVLLVCGVSAAAAVRWRRAR